MKVKTTSQVLIKHTLTFDALENQALRSRDNLSHLKFDRFSKHKKVGEKTSSTY